MKILWQRARQSEVRHGPACPVCAQPTNEVAVPGKVGEIHLDVCRPCRFLWFDPHELEALPAQLRAPQPKEDTLSDEAREKIAIAQAEMVKATATGKRSEPDGAWKWTAALLMGVPVEHEVQSLRAQPWITWILSAVVVLVSVAAMFELGPVVRRFGLIPEAALRYGGLTFLTSFFLHGGVAHLAGNIYFLLIFGDNVEDYLGRVRYVALLCSATLLGGVVHVLLSPSANVSCIGASAGIAGVIVFYALQFPRARLSVLFMYFWWFTFPAIAAIVFWLLTQVFLTYLQVAGAGSISGLAHLGGAAAGLITWLVGRILEMPAVAGVES